MTRQPSGVAPTSPVTPTPHRYDVNGGSGLLIHRFRLDADAGTDASTRAVVTTALQDAGGRPLDPGAETVSSPPVEIKLRTGATAGEAPSGPELPAGGYSISVDPEAAAVTLHGADPAGTWSAVQTLRQLIDRSASGARLPVVHVRDWPRLPMRGVIEGFYGPTWSHQDRLSMLRFCGAHKMNTFVYAPKHDPYHRRRWREPYPPEELAGLSELVTVARAQHVEFVYTIAPGLSLRHSDDGDFSALRGKAEQLAGCGVRAFWLLFDDIETSLRDPVDVERFGDEVSPLAAAQAFVANRFRREFYRPRGFTDPLVVVPVDYAGTSPSDYRRCLAARLDPDIPVGWTGPDVVSRTIGAADVSAAAASFGDHELVVWDNYPTNDFDPSRLFLGPLRGRDPAVGEPPVRGFVANAMVQAGPSRLPLVTIADYLWNPQDYDPARAHRLALAELGGEVAGALGVFAAACDEDQSRTLREMIAAFWRGYDTDPMTAPYPSLLDRFEGLVTAGSTVTSNLADDDFRREAVPWLRTMQGSGLVGSAALRALAAQAGGDDELAWQQAHRFQFQARRLAELYPAVLRDIIDAFVRRAAAALDIVTMTARARAGGALVLSSTVRRGAVPVRHVEFLERDEIVARAADGAPATTWPNAPAGGHRLVARASRLDATSVTSAPTWVVVDEARTALVLVDDEAEPSSGDVTLRDRLASLGFAASVRATVASAGPPDLVVVAAGARAEAVATARTLPAPVLACGAFADLGLARACDIEAPAERLDVRPDAGPLGGELPPGPVAVYRGPGRLRWGTVGEQAAVAATIEGDPGKACAFGYPAGATMAGLRAPARRAGTFVSAAGLLPALVTRRGLDLFDAAVRWVTA